MTRVCPFKPLFFGDRDHDEKTSLQKTSALSRHKYEPFLFKIMVEKANKGKFVMVDKEEYEQFLEAKRQKERNETIKVQFRVKKHYKEEWERFVEQNKKFKSVSQLIRKAVNSIVFPDVALGSLKNGEVPEDFDEGCQEYLSRIDNWKAYKRIRKIEQVIQEYNAAVTHDHTKEEFIAKLRSVQQNLLSVIFELASVIPNED